MLLPLLMLLFVVPPVYAAAPVTQATVYEASLDTDMINPATADYLVRAIDLAEQHNAQALLLRIDTPGGMLQSTRQIVRAMLNAHVPIITYVAPGGAQAGSAGVFITLAGNIAAMAPGTNIGAAHPVGGQGQDLKSEGGSDLAKKIENDTRAFVESIAHERHRNEQWAAQAVTQSVSITAEQALQLKVVDLIADSDADLLSQIDGRQVTVAGKTVILHTRHAQVEPVQMDLKQRLVNLLANPNIAYLLMVVGFLGIYFEMSHPGAIFPGVAGGLSLILAFVSLQVLPFNAAGLALILLAVALFVAEIFVTSYGLLTAGGLIALVLGSLFLFDTPDAVLRIDRGLIVGVALAVGVSVAVVSYLVAKTFGRPVSTGKEGMMGKIGEAAGDLTPRGKVFINGEYWNVVATEHVRQGQRVRVIAVEGLMLKVQPVRDVEGGFDA